MEAIMRKHRGGIPLLVCLLSFGAGVGVHAQQRVYDPYPDGESRQEYVEQYARAHNLTKQQKKALENRLRAEDRNWSRLSFREQRQIARARAEAQRMAVYGGNTGSIVYDPNRSNRDSNRDDSYQYRIGRSGRLTDRNGAVLLQRALDEGYRQGFDSGATDRAQNHNYDFGRDRTYQDATSGYTNYVDVGDYQFYFRQGYQLGYDDGYSRRLRYGSMVNGRATILDAVVGSVLGFSVR
jgi:hypothetical protein